jgi:DNA processing protein
MGSMREDLHCWLALRSVRGVGNTTFKRLIEALGSPEKVLASGIPELLKVEGVGRSLADNIVRFKPDKKIIDEIDQIERLGISVVTLNNSAYPERLKKIYDPPPILYIKGEIKKEDENAIAIVGARNATTYGRTVTERLSSELVSYGYTIVSGMARGVDTFAHQGAMTAGGRTIAVLGSGIDIIYPPDNRELAGKIAKNGAIISEFQLGTPPERINFPKRNRIISGISAGVLVIEASNDSGSLITANAALEQGREVFAIPGNINSRNSSGTNGLIKKGAKLVENIDDILEELLPQLARREVGMLNKEERCNLSGEEELICKLILYEPRHIDEITFGSGLPSSRVSTILLGLELKGAVRQLDGNLYIKK